MGPASHPWGTLRWGVGGVSKLGGILFAVWAVEEVKQVLMIYEHRCLVVIVVVLLGRGPVEI